MVIADLSKVNHEEQSLSYRRPQRLMM